MKGLFLSLIIFLSINILAQTDTWKTEPLPSNLQKSINSICSDCKLEKWKQSRSGAYIIFINKDDDDKIVRLNEDGSWIETISFVSEDKVHPSIVSDMKEVYPNAISIEYQYINKAQGTDSYYITVINDDDTLEIVYTANGDFISKTSLEDDTD